MGNRHDQGIRSFHEDFADSVDDFVVVGGVAAHEIMGSAGLEFRATKDIDLVIIARPAVAFCGKLVTYIEAGRYEVRQSKEGKPGYYRFMKPKEVGYPVQIEIFSRRPEDLVLHENQHIVPITETPAGADLSAILLEDEYYELIKSTLQIIKGLPIAGTEAVMALKSRAFNDLKDRKAAGDSSVSSDEIKKHRNDILRLSQALPQHATMSLAGLPEIHMRKFLEEIETTDNVEVKQLFKQFGIADDRSVLESSPALAGDHLPRGHTSRRTALKITAGGPIKIAAHKSNAAGLCRKIGKLLYLLNDAAKTSNID